MYSLNRLAQFLIVLQLAIEISWIYCHSAKEDINPDVWKSLVESIDFNANDINSSYNTIQNIDPDESVKLSNKGGSSLEEENKNGLSNYYSGLNNINKRNVDSNHRMGKRRQMKHKKSNEIKIARAHPFRRKSKEGQHKEKLNKIKKEQDQETSLYDNNNKISFKDEKSKYSVKHLMDISYKNSETSNENTPNKCSVFNKEEGTKVDEESISNITENSNTDKDGNSIIDDAKDKTENNIELRETEPMNKEYQENKNVQQLQHESINSENSDEYVKKGHKLERKNLNKQTITENSVENTESSKQERKPYISALSKTKPSSHHSSDIKYSSLKSGKHFETDVPVVVLHNENNVHKKSLSPQIDDELNENKDADIRKKSEQSKHNNVYVIEKDDLLERKNNNKEIKSHNGFEASNKKSYSIAEKEDSNKPFLEHVNHKTIHNTVLNINEQNHEPNHHSFQNRNIYDVKIRKQRKRSKKKASLKRRQSPTSNSERGNYDNSLRETSIDDSDSNSQQEIKSVEHVTELSEDTENKRDQRDINKRFRKHNDKNHMTQEGEVFGYLHNREDNENLSDEEIEEGQGSNNVKDNDSSEYQDRKDGVNSNNDKYSYKEAFEEERGAINAEENSNNKFIRKKTFSRQSHESRQKGADKDKCVNYKSEKATKKPTCSTVSTAEKCTTKGTTCKNKQTTIKTKTAMQTSNKSQTTKRVELENKKNNSNSEALDIFEKYLCGQLADDFVDAVMGKVKKSRKIYKELGFRNDSEETCDRCIETKPSKMPGKETIKISMVKCLKNNKPSCPTCYSVPRPMEKLLNLLVLFEKEHENSVYNKIRDDSSFIFTGDYPEQLSPNYNSVGNKYASDRDSFNKETFDKQDLREDSNEDSKQNDQVPNTKVLEDEDTTLEVENKHVEHSTDTGMNENENIDSTFNVKNVMKNSNVNYKNKETSSLELDDKIEESEFNDDSDMNVVPRSKYTILDEPETSKPDGFIDRASTKERRKALKSEKFKGPKHIYSIKGPEREDASIMKTNNLRERSFGFVENNPSKDRYDSENIVVQKKHDDISEHENVRLRHKTPFQFKNGWVHSENKDKLSPFNYQTNEKFSHKSNNYFNYPSEDYNDEVEPLHSQNNGHPVADGFMTNGWDGNEYQIMPKQPNREPSKQIMLSSIPKKIYHKSDYEERLNMVKRESEPSYDDEPLFFEIPNIEYDLY